MPQLILKVLFIKKGISCKKPWSRKHINLPQPFCHAPRCSHTFNALAITQGSCNRLCKLWGFSNGSVHHVAYVHARLTDEGALWERLDGVRGLAGLGRPFTRSEDPFEKGHNPTETDMPLLKTDPT